MATRSKEAQPKQKKNTVVFKLVQRDSSDPNYDESGTSNTVYQLVHYTKDEFLSEEEKAKRDRLMGIFSEKDQGIFDPAKARKKTVPAVQQQDSSSQPKDVWDKIKDKDLWIHHLMRMKQEQQLDEVEVDAVEEVDEEEQDLSEEQQQDSQKNKEEEWKKYVLESDDLQIDYSKLKFSDSVSLKKYNEFGRPMDDGYDYSRHKLRSDSEGGQVIAVFSSEIKLSALKLEPDIDYKEEEMTAEQKEVFQALQVDGEGGYEELEDDFVTIANEGEKCIVQNDLLNTKAENSQRVKYTAQTLDAKPKSVSEGSKQLDSQDEQQSQKYQSKLQPEEEEEEEEQEDLLEDEEFDELQLQQAMQEFEELGARAQNQQHLTRDEFDDILDEHLEEMESDGRAQQLNYKEHIVKKVPKKANAKKVSFSLTKNQPAEQEIAETEEGTEDADKENEDKKNKESKDEREIRLKEQFGDEFFTRVHEQPLKPEEDNALKGYLERVEKGEDQLNDPLAAYIEKEDGEQDEENIVTKSFNTTSIMRGDLNVIGGMQRQKKNSIALSSSEIKKSIAAAQTQKQKLEEAEIFVKRQKGETPEEKKHRKEQLKEFKKQRRDKKKQFKEGFENLAREKVKKVNAQTQNQSLKGVSVIKL